MYCFKILNQIKLVFLLKFIVHELNYKIIKSEIILLSEREKTDANKIYSEYYNLMLNP
jgi:hypothetical protein